MKKRNDNVPIANLIRYHDLKKSKLLESYAKTGGEPEIKRLFREFTLLTAKEAEALYRFYIFKIQYELKHSAEAHIGLKKDAHIVLRLFSSLEPQEVECEHCGLVYKIKRVFKCEAKLSDYYVKKLSNVSMWREDAKAKKRDTLG